MLHQRHDVGKAFMKREYVGIGRLVETPVNAIEDRMRGFVRDDVVRQTRVDHAAGSMIAGIVRRRFKVTKQQSNLLRAVKGVRLPQSVRAHEQLADKLTIVKRVIRISSRSPKHRPAQRAFEVLDRLHGHGIGHLLMKSRIAFSGGTAVLREQARIIQINRWVFLAGGVHIDDFEVLAFRSWPLFGPLERFPSYFQRHLADRRGIQLS